MAIDFAAFIADEQKAEIIKQRLNQFIVEGYQLSLNKKAAVKLEKQDQVEAIDANLALLEAAIVSHQEELATISVEKSE